MKRKLYLFTFNIGLAILLYSTFLFFYVQLFYSFYGRSSITMEVKNVRGRFLKQALLEIPQKTLQYAKYVNTRTRGYYPLPHLRCGYSEVYLFCRFIKWDKIRVVVLEKPIPLPLHGNEEIVFDRFTSKYFYGLSYFCLGCFVVFLSFYGLNKKTTLECASFWVQYKSSMTLVMILAIFFTTYYLNAKNEFVLSRNKILQKACTANMQMLENALEMYDMDQRKNPEDLFVSSNRDIEKLEKYSESLQFGGYISRVPVCPSTKKSSSFSICRNDTGKIMIECEIHGTVSQPTYKQ